MRKIGTRLPHNLFDLDDLSDFDEKTRTTLKQELLLRDKYVLSKAEKEILMLFQVKDPLHLSEIVVALTRLRKKVQNRKCTAQALYVLVKKGKLKKTGQPATYTLNRST